MSVPSGMSVSIRSRKPVKVTALLRAITSVKTSPVLTSSAAMRDAVPWRMYSNSWRAAWPGVRHDLPPARRGNGTPGRPSGRGTRRGRRLPRIRRRRREHRGPVRRRAPQRRRPRHRRQARVLRRHHGRRVRTHHRAPRRRRRHLGRWGESRTGPGGGPCLAGAGAGPGGSAADRPGRPRGVPGLQRQGGLLRRPGGFRPHLPVLRPGGRRGLAHGVAAPGSGGGSGESTRASRTLAAQGRAAGTDPGARPRGPRTPRTSSTTAIPASQAWPG